MKKLIAAAAAAAGLLTATMAWAQGLQDFRLVNRTGYTIMTVQVGSSSDSEWGEDLMGADVLPTGRSVEIEFDAGEDRCLWDIRVTYEDGDEGDFRQVNLCEVSTITLTPTQAVAS